MKKLTYWGIALFIGLLVVLAFWWVKAEEKDRKEPLDQSEQIEKERLNDFFTELHHVYGYLYTAENESLQLFLKIDEALREGELSATLLMMETTGDKSNSYKETKYTLNGITDGLMVEFFTTVDGEPTKLKGNFHEGAASFDLSFWTTDQKLLFREVTEEEFKQRYEKFKKQ